MTQVVTREKKTIDGPFYKLVQPNGEEAYGQSQYGMWKRDLPIQRDRIPIDMENMRQRKLRISKWPVECIQGAGIPCRIFEVDPGEPDFEDDTAMFFSSPKVLGEVYNINELMGFNYTEFVKIGNPFERAYAKVTEEHIELLGQWQKVGKNAGDILHEAIKESLGHDLALLISRYLGVHVWQMMDDCFEKFSDYDNDIHREVLLNSWDFAAGRAVQFFPLLKGKEFYDREGKYIYQSASDLWNVGLIPTFRDGIARLHGGHDAKILYEEKKD